MKLDEFLETAPSSYRKVYEVLKPRLPEGIEVRPLPANERVLGCAFREKGVVMFSQIPPSLVTFTHELIHLCKKPSDDLSEEIWGYNLTPIVLFMVEEGLEGDPFRLFLLSKREINEVLEREIGVDIEGFYKVLGIIPFLGEKAPSERDEVVVFFGEISGGLAYFPICRKILKALIEKEG